MKKNCIHVFLFSIFILTISQTNFGQSSISGIIYDKQRNALTDIDVELLNDLYQTIRRTRTDGIGKYQFDGLSNGRFIVKVYAFRYDLEDQTQDIEVNTQSIRGGTGVGFFPLDFYLLPKKGGLAANETEVVFAQTIPSEAKKLYEKALNEFSKNKTALAITTLNQALTIFPDYFIVLQRLGKELFIQQRYEESAQFFFKAIEVNHKHANSYYYLGVSLYKLGKDYYPAAFTSLNQAHLLAPSSIQILWSLGKVERGLGKYIEAEKHLLKAKKLSNNSYGEIHKELAELYSNELKKYKEAADEIELFLKASKVSKETEDDLKKKIFELRAKSKN
jgi:tetratricopeptide (TPR) repeat protein